MGRWTYQPTASRWDQKLRQRAMDSDVIDDGGGEGARSFAREVEGMNFAVLMDLLACWAHRTGLIGLELDGRIDPVVGLLKEGDTAAASLVWIWPEATGDGSSSLEIVYGGCRRDERRRRESCGAVAQRARISSSSRKDDACRRRDDVGERSGQKPQIVAHLWVVGPPVFAGTPGMVTKVAGSCWTRGTRPCSSSLLV